MCIVLAVYIVGDDKLFAEIPRNIFGIHVIAIEAHRIRNSKQNMVCNKPNSIYKPKWMGSVTKIYICGDAANDWINKKLIDFIIKLSEVIIVCATFNVNKKWFWRSPKTVKAIVVVIIVVILGTGTMSLLVIRAEKVKYVVKWHTG